MIGARINFVKQFNIKRFIRKLFVKLNDENNMTRFQNW